MRVTELWRYPVKSVGGERLDQAEIGDRGVVGDRHWALADPARDTVLTARREPKLLFASARLRADGGCELTLDDGSVLTFGVDEDRRAALEASVEAGIDERLSRWLGHPVALVGADAHAHASYEIAIDFEDEDGSEWVSWDGPDGSFHDSARAQISLLSVASIRDWDVRRFRANVVVDTGDEQDLVGHAIRIGTMEASVVKPIDRCVMTTRPQPGGIERDLDVLRTINRDYGGNLAAGALITVPGLVSVGDEVVVLD